jgi:GntR family transcriptional repressor for pyruvate dehydrogenase complex
VIEMSAESPVPLTALLGDGVGPAGERVAEALRRAVILRVFAGERLPPERELARLFGVSRITVRQAIQSLRAEGHLYSRAGRGGGTYQVLRPASRSWRSKIDRAWGELMEVLEFRVLVEPLAARLAARRTSSALASTLRRSIEDMAASRRLEEFRHADSVFHLSIAEAAGNARLLQAIATARADFLMWRDRLPAPFRPGNNVEEHARVLEALVARDADAAEEAMKTHLESAKRDFRREMRHLGLEPWRQGRHGPRAAVHREGRR